MKLSIDSSGARQLLDYLGHRGGLDFASYRQASLLRRIEWRMAKVGVETFADYHRLLLRDASEHGLLCLMVPVHKTSFFRDDIWDYVGRVLAPPLLAQAADLERTVRIWAAGCATGEEAYTLAIVLSEALAVEARRRGPRRRASRRSPWIVRPFIILATDVSTDAVERTGQGRYHAHLTDTIPERLRDRYLDLRTDGDYDMSRRTRACVQVSQHDLLLDAPLADMDLIFCRNTLMYFKVAAQRRVLDGLAGSLRPGGTLVCGSAESPAIWNQRFRARSRENRAFGLRDEAEMPAPESSATPPVLPETTAG